MTIVAQCLRCGIKTPSFHKTKFGYYVCEICYPLVLGLWKFEPGNQLDLFDKKVNKRTQTV